MRENIIDRRFHPENHILSLKKSFFKRFTTIVKQSVLLTIICTTLCTLIYFTWFYNDIYADKPPIITQENSELFKKRYIFQIHDDKYNGIWYKIRKMPQDLVQSWKHDDQLLRLKFSNPKQIDINHIRMEYYHLNVRKAERTCTRTMIWVWLCGIVLYFSLKIRKHLARWNEDNKYN